MQASTSNGGAIILLIALGCGLAAALVAWLLSRTLAAVPREDREYKDPPPLGFKLMWWPIQWLSHFIGPLIAAPRHGAVLTQLRQTGLDYTISPAQFISARIACALLSALLFLW